MAKTEKTKKGLAPSVGEEQEKEEKEQEKEEKEKEEEEEEKKGASPLAWGVGVAIALGLLGIFCGASALLKSPEKSAQKAEKTAEKAEKIERKVDDLSFVVEAREDCLAKLCDDSTTPPPRASRRKPRKVSARKRKRVKKSPRKGGLEARVLTLEHDMYAPGGRVSRLDKEVKSLQGGLDALYGAHDGLREDVNTLRRRVRGHSKAEPSP